MANFFYLLDKKLKVERHQSLLFKLASDVNSRENWGSSRVVKSVWSCKHENWFTFPHSQVNRMRYVSGEQFREVRTFWDSSFWFTFICSYSLADCSIKLFCESIRNSRLHVVFILSLIFAVSIQCFLLHLAIIVLARPLCKLLFIIFWPFSMFIALPYSEGWEK